MSVIVLEPDAATVTLNGYAFSHLMAGANIELAPVNEFSSHVNSRNDGVSIQKRVDHGVRDLTLRVQRNSPDDVFLNSALNSGALTIFNGSIKEVFTRDGIAGVSTWTMENGSFTTQPSASQNDQDGDALMEYVIRFRNVSRSL